MPRISYIEPQNASVEVQQLYEHRLGGKPGSVHKIMAHQPKAMTAFLAFYASAGSSLDRDCTNWSTYACRCSTSATTDLQHHLASSKRIGVTPEDWQALEEGDLHAFYRCRARCIEVY